ncbi:MAG: PVC-type heme-binding CxxCH protein [Planctomycetales bacterium]
MHSLVLCLLASAALAADPNPAHHVISLPGHNFTIPEGFTIELVAGPGLVDRPIHADFDERGRLYVCESSGTNDKVDQQLAERPHWIVCLEDTDGDGRFDRSTKFAEGLMFPEGMLWHAGSVYVAAPPSIWKFTDTDDDGVADQRVEWFQGQTLTGCANDLHGPYLGRDGWVYWAKGAFAEQRYDRPGRAPLVTRAAHLFRCRTDGTEVEPVMTGGMDNPVEVVFTAGGERIFTTTFLQHPGGGKRDGLIHAIYGGVYGKPHGVLDGHPRTGDLMPVMTHLGPAAPAGLALYESRVFGQEYEGNLFAALFNLHKVTRHVLQPQGAMFVTQDQDFLVSDNLDFHPTDVLEDADGSLLVVNTGGWYKLCCPTSQLWKPDVLGGIYRVRRDGGARVADPRGGELEWDQLPPDRLALLLGDERPALVRRSIEGLVRRGKGAIPVLVKTLSQGRSLRAQRQAVWALARIDGDDAREGVRAALDNHDDTVRQAAIHAISVRRDRDAVPQLIETLVGGTPFNRRAAAEALGRLGHSAAVPALLAVAGEAPDRVLEHSVIYALIEIADPAETAHGLESSHSTVQRAALLAIDQMEGGMLDPRRVAGILTSGDDELKETALSIIGRHPEWGEALTPFLERLLFARDLPEEDATRLVQLLTRFADQDEVQTLIASGLDQESLAIARQRLLFRVLGGSGLKELPATWAAPLIQALRENDELTPLAVAAARAYTKFSDQEGALRGALLAAASRKSLPLGVRLEALAAIPGGLSQVDPTVFDLVRSSLTPETQISIRLFAAEVLSKARLDDRQLVALGPTVQSAGPLELERVVAPYAHARSDQVGIALVGALIRSEALTSLRPEALRGIFKDYSKTVNQQAERVFVSLAEATEKQKVKTEELLTLLPQGDIRRGQAVFNSQKGACAACHAIGYLGGTIGPDLTRIGGTRSERDLLEAIVFPSAGFVRSYEPVVVTTKAGKSYSGTIRKDSPEEVILALNAQETVRISRGDIDDMVPGTVSIMPAGLDQQLSPQDLVDLIVFLKGAK